MSNERKSRIEIVYLLVAHVAQLEKAGQFPERIEKALKADRPVIIDVVIDIDALAPLAVS